MTSSINTASEIDDLRGKIAEDEAELARIEAVRPETALAALRGGQGDLNALAETEAVVTIRLRNRRAALAALQAEQQAERERESNAARAARQAQILEATDRLLAASQAFDEAAADLARAMTERAEAIATLNRLNALTWTQSSNLAAGDALVGALERAGALKHLPPIQGLRDPVPLREMDGFVLRRERGPVLQGRLDAFRAAKAPPDDVDDPEMLAAGLMGIRKPFREARARNRRTRAADTMRDIIGRPTRDPLLTGAEQ